MRKTVCTILSAVAGLLCLAAPARCDDLSRVPGLWRLAAFYAKDARTGAQVHIYGERPWGYLAGRADGRFDAWATTDRSSHGSSGAPPMSIWEQVAQSLETTRAVFYTGQFRLEGGASTVQFQQVQYEGWIESGLADAFWNERLTEIGELRSFRHGWDELGNEFLRVETAPLVRPDSTEKMIIGTMIWLRSHEWGESGPK